MRALLQAILIIIGMLVTTFGNAAQAQGTAGLPSFQSLSPLPDPESTLEEMRAAQSPEDRAEVAKAVKRIFKYQKPIFLIIEFLSNDLSECREACCKCAVSQNGGESYGQCEADSNDMQSCEKCEKCKERYSHESLAGKPEQIDPQQPYELPKLTAENLDFLNQVVGEWGQLSAPTQ